MIRTLIRWIALIVVVLVVMSIFFFGPGAFFSKIKSITKSLFGVKLGERAGEEIPALDAETEKEFDKLCFSISSAFRYNGKCVVGIVWNLSPEYRVRILGKRSKIRSLSGEEYYVMKYEMFFLKGNHILKECNLTKGIFAPFLGNPNYYGLWLLGSWKDSDFECKYMKCNLLDINCKKKSCNGFCAGGIEERIGLLFEVENRKLWLGKTSNGLCVFKNDEEVLNKIKQGLVDVCSSESEKLVENLLRQGLGFFDDFKKDEAFEIFDVLFSFYPDELNLVSSELKLDVDFARLKFYLLLLEKFKQDSWKVDDIEHKLLNFNSEKGKELLGDLFDLLLKYNTTSFSVELEFSEVWDALYETLNALEIRSELEREYSAVKTLRGRKVNWDGVLDSLRSALDNIWKVAENDFTVQFEKLIKKELSNVCNTHKTELSPANFVFCENFAKWL
ncbi:hypothetical protein DRJ16_06395 [Candidatus Woesearchaeota archaeon]|nr:MAG: hypothetical protein DRJ16_06395 [Candidatus Woesearchaeota archaeon]